MRYAKLWRRAISVSGLLALALALASCDPGESGHVGEEAGKAGALAAHAHQVQGQTCFICDPAKRDKGRLWCREHGRYEDRCWICHPELEDKERPYCREHFLYEDECFLCHPELQKEEATGMSASESAATAASGALFCNEHQVPEMECGICQPQRAASLQPGQSLLVRLPSAESAHKAGIEIGQPRESERTPGLWALCEVHYNGNALARVVPLTDGIVRRVAADVGDQVAAGEVLLELHSAEVAQAKSAYLAALVSYDLEKEALARERTLAEEAINARKDYLEAEGAFRLARLAVNNARQKLLNLGLTAEAIAQIERAEDSSALLEIRAPFSATLIDRAAVSGQAVRAGEALFTLADLRTRWLALSIPADRLSEVRVGQFVEAQLDDLPGEVVRGKLVWIDAEVDRRTRLVRARAVVSEGVERIRTGMFGRAKVLTHAPRSGWLVPREAVQHHERQPFVFVQEAPDLYALRRVVLGERAERTVEVLAGLQADDAVVASGFVVMSEFLKSRLGAGCVD